MSKEEQQWRREKLYNEAERVSLEAWNQALITDNPSQKANLLKVVLAANQRKASLCGLDQIEINVNSHIEANHTVDVVTQVETEFKLRPGALEDLGKQAALLFSQNPDKVETVDVQPEPVPVLPGGDS